MFERPYHLRIANVLQSLNSDLLARNHCFFGGGTAVVLLRSEYRESNDVDFVVSDRAGYRALRQAVTGPAGIRALLRAGADLKVAADVRADQYGIRTMFDVAGTNVKFEIVFEARITLEAPTATNHICGVATLTLLDLAATKLLANSDRWADDSVFSRDLLDLAMLGLPKSTFQRAKEKAAEAYGESVERDLVKAIDRLKKRHGRLDDCMTALRIEGVTKAVLWQRIRRLASRRTLRH